MFSGRKMYDDIEEEDDLDARMFGGKNVVIFLVDGSRKMHEALEEGSNDTLFSSALNSINATLKVLNLPLNICFDKSMVSENSRLLEIYDRPTNGLVGEQ